ncbi:MAG TPA: tripartite tricarboxylate transporter substrate binding protein, partial [Reyranella sp.]
MTKAITRRATLALGGAALAAPSLGRADTALPDKTLKILVGFPAGGGSDVMARFIAEALKQRTGRNVIIDNKTGASGTLAG